MGVVEVCIVEDDAVRRKLKSTSKSLKKKFEKTRKINGKLIKEKTSALQKLLSVICNAFIMLAILFALTLCFSIAVSRMTYTATSYAGFNIFQITSGSMEESGFNVGDTIVVRSVNPKSLKVGDIIGFYVYKPSYQTFNKKLVTQITEFENSQLQYKVGISNFLGISSKEHKNAGKANASIVFHSIVAVYEDQNGERWFETKGTSNSTEDFWKINEKYVIGAYTNSTLANIAKATLTFFNNNGNFMLLLLVPFVALTIVIIFNIIKHIQLVKLELDVVEEKRKITDEICVRNEIGYNMDIKTKYKVLAQAEDKDKKRYIQLLFKSGEVPQNVLKYVLKKRISLEYMKEMLILNRTCESMFKNGENLAKISRHYLHKRQKIENEFKASIKPCTSKI